MRARELRWRRRHARPTANVRSGDMLPSFALDSHRYGRCAYTEDPGNLPVRHAGCAQLTSAPDRVLVEPGPVVRRASRGPVAPFRHHVGVVVSHGPLEQVLRVDARWVVAAVQTTGLRPPCCSQEEGDAVSQLHAPIEAHVTVTSSDLEPGPQPAGSKLWRMRRCWAALINSRPEPLPRVVVPRVPGTRQTAKASTTARVARVLRESLSTMSAQ